MVRLKVNEKGRYSYGVGVFQFQYGSIKRNSFHQDPEHNYLFQFQYGSIKRMALLISLQTMLYFNSNMVRLKEK